MLGGITEQTDVFSQISQTHIREKTVPLTREISQVIDNEDVRVIISELVRKECVLL